MIDEIEFIPGKMFIIKEPQTMRETRYDGTEHCTEEATRDHVNIALDNPDNESVEIFYAGAEVKKNGKAFVVNRNGNLVRHPADTRRNK